MESATGGADDLDKGIEELFYKLLGAAEDVDDILHKLRESVWFQTALRALQIYLSTQHVNLMLDKDHVDCRLR